MIPLEHFMKAFTAYQKVSKGTTTTRAFTNLSKYYDRVFFEKQFPAKSPSQLALTCSKSTRETPGQYVKYVQT